MKMYFGRERSKSNLIPLPYNFGTGSRSGIDITVNDDGSIKIKGTATANIYLTLGNYTEDIFPKGTYYISGNNPNAYIWVERMKNGQYVSGFGQKDRTFTLDWTTYDTIRIYHYINNGKTVDETLYPMLNEGETALPYFVPRQVKPIVKIPSTNLIAFPYEENNKTHLGVTFITNSDGSILVNGQNTGVNNSVMYLVKGSSKIPLTMKANVPYTLSIETSDSKLNATIHVAGKYYSAYNNYPATITLTEDTIANGLYIQVSNGNTTIYENVVAKIMLAEGKTALPYKPYGDILQKCTPLARKLSTNLFDAKKIARADMIVNEDGSEILIPLATSGNGQKSTQTTLSELCPEIRVRDKLWLSYSTNIPSGNGMIYLVSSNKFWYSNTSNTITELDLQSLVSLYGNRFIDGYTEQITIQDFRITREKDTPFEPYYQKIV